jgi:hypothetical protein
MQRRGVRRSAAIVSIAALGVIGVIVSVGSGPASVAAVPRAHHTRDVTKPVVAVFGDSLITQALTNLTRDLKNATVEQYSYPAVAACFYTGAGGVEKYLQTHRPKVAILEFWGNDNRATPCMTSPKESFGYYAQYEADVKTLTTDFVKAGAHVFIIGTIPDATQVASGDPLWDHLNDVYRTIPSMFKKRLVSFVNVQPAVEEEGHFTWYLPCLPAEPSCDDSVAGVTAAPPSGDNIVRSKEGLHFCPRFPDTTNFWANFVKCDAYSSGSFRYARAIARVVESFLRTGRAPRFIGPPLPTPDTPVFGINGQIDPYTGTAYPQP